MSQMQIQIIDTEVKSAKSKAGKDYNLVVVTYKNLSFQGKVEEKKHNQFGDATVYNTLKEAKKGDTITIVREKDDAGYWQWVGVAADKVLVHTDSSQKATSANPVPAKTTGGGNWETPEERAKRQVYIVRQSSIGHAVETLKTDKKAPSVDEVLHVAKIYEQYVFGVNLEADAIHSTNKLPELDDEDIPM